MRKLRDVLRLRLSSGLSIREISRITKLSVGGSQKLLTQAASLELNWPLPDDLDDTQLAGCSISRPTPASHAATRCRTGRSFTIQVWIIHWKALHDTVIQIRHDRASGVRVEPVREWRGRQVGRRGQSRRYSASSRDTAVHPTACAYSRMRV